MPPTSSRPRTGRSRTEHGIPVVPALIALSAIAAVGGALAGAHPVGVAWLDGLWSALFAVAVVLGASRSRRMATIWMAGIAGVVAVGGDSSAIVFGVASLAGAGVTAFTRRRERLLGAVVGLFAAQALLRGATFGFVGLPTLVAAAAVIPVFVSAWRIGRSRERKVALWALVGLIAVVLIGGAAAGIAANEARPHLQAASDGADQALDLLHAGDTAAAADEFSKAQYQFERASGTLNGPLGYVGRAVPVVAQQLDAVRQVSIAGEDLGFAASQAAATADWRQLTATAGTVDLAQISAMQAPLAASSDAIDAALTTATDVRSPWLVGPLDDELDTFEARLLDAAEEARLTSDGITVAPALLGADGPRRYLVAFATPGETRNAGGFIGAFAVVDAENGSLSVGRTGSTMTDLRGGGPLDLPAEWNAAYGGFAVDRYPGNVSAGPDWPTDAAVAAEVYAKSPEGSPVDGVIYADPAALAALLRLTGPVDVPRLRQPLTAENAEQYLLVDQYVQFASNNDERKDVLGDVAEAVFDALTSRPLPGIQALTDALGPVVAEGHLRIASLRGGDEEAFLRTADVDGAFVPTPGSDVVSVRSSNASESKIDAWLHRDVQVDATYDPRSGAVTSDVTVTLHNEAPDKGFPNYLLGNSFGLPRGTNRHMISLYTPLKLQSVAVDGVESGASRRRELGLDAYTIVSDIPPGGEVTLSFHLVGAVAPGTDYRIDLLPQPIANPDQVSLKVRRADADAPPVPVYDGPLLEPLQLAVGLP